jgi:hypothetical protein
MIVCDYTPRSARSDSQGRSRLGPFADCPAPFPDLVSESLQYTLETKGGPVAVHYNLNFKKKSRGFENNLAGREQEKNHSKNTHMMTMCPPETVKSFPSVLADPNIICDNSISCPRPFLLMFQLVVLALVAYSIWRVQLYLKDSPLNNLDGPKPSSFLTGTVMPVVRFTRLTSADIGNLSDFHNPDGWDFHQDLEQNYGQVVKIRGLLGVSQLFIALILFLHLSRPSSYTFSTLLHYTRCS